MSSPCSEMAGIHNCACPFPWLWGQSSDPQACAARTLPMEASPHPPKLILNRFAFQSKCPPKQIFSSNFQEHCEILNSQTKVNTDIGVSACMPKDVVAGRIT